MSLECWSALLAMMIPREIGKNYVGVSDVGHVDYSSFSIGWFDKNVTTFAINTVRGPINSLDGCSRKCMENVENEPVANEDRWNNRCGTWCTRLVNAFFACNNYHRHLFSNATDESSLMKYIYEVYRSVFFNDRYLACSFIKIKSNIMYCFSWYI